MENQGLVPHIRKSVARVRTLVCYHLREARVLRDPTGDSRPAALPTREDSRTEGGVVGHRTERGETKRNIHFHRQTSRSREGRVPSIITPPEAPTRCPEGRLGLPDFFVSIGKEEATENPRGPSYTTRSNRRRRSPRAGDTPMIRARDMEVPIPKHPVRVERRAETMLHTESGEDAQLSDTFRVRLRAKIDINPGANTDLLRSRDNDALETRLDNNEIFKN
jgi:hypothetical protein